jgi:cGMP-dependent protein kinase
MEYTFSVDLWSLGICMFELMCGFVPYGEEEEDPYKIYF